LIEYRGEGELPVFAHHSLLVGKDGEGLSKRIGSLGIEVMREEGLEPQALTSLLARLGTSDPIEPRLSLEEMAEGFDFDRMGRAPARFDAEELRQLNAKILHMMPYEDLQERLTALSVDEALWTVAKGNIELLSDIEKWRDVVTGEVEPLIEADDKAVTDAAAAAVPPGDVTEADWSALVDKVKAETGAKGRRLFMPLRKALTGVDHGPEMAPMFALIGAEKAKARFSGQRA
ncbi:MAG: glutamate--tRNA ligase family protein, partial [Pseudomonadota bacterium]